MKYRSRRLLRLVVILTIATFPGVFAVNAAGAQVNGTITGTVDVPGPLGPWGINVSAVNVSTGVIAATTAADNSGRYTLSVPPATYAVWFVPAGRLTFAPAVALYHNASSYDAATPVTVTAGGTATLAHQSSQPAGRVSGTITDSDGRNVDGCFVAVLTRTPTPTLVGIAGTNFLGNYSIGNLPLGQMNVLAICGAGFAVTYNGNTTDLAQAVPVTITTQSGGALANIVAARTPRSVAGRLTLTGGSGAGGGCVSAHSAGGQELGSAIVRGDGSWAIADLPVGDVRIEFESCPGSNTNYVTEWYDDQPDLAAATPVPVVASAPTTQIDAVITRYSGLGFTFTNAGGDPVSGVCIWVTDTAATRLVTAQYAGGSFATIERLLPGTYSVFFTDCGGNGFSGEWYEDSPTHAGSTPLAANEAVIDVTNVVLG